MIHIGEFLNRFHLLWNGRAVQVIQIGEKWVEIKSQGKLGYIHREDFDENFSEISLNIG